MHRTKRARRRQRSRCSKSPRGFRLKPSPVTRAYIPYRAMPIAICSSIRVASQKCASGLDSFFSGTPVRNSLLDVALVHLSLGRAELLLDEHSEARAQLDYAVEHLRRAGDIRYLPRGLLARAAFFRVIEHLGLAHRDLNEAMRIAKRSEMRLFQCDAHLECAQLALAKDDEEKAREHVAEARRLVDETGYGRRRPNVEELEAQIRGSARVERVK